MIYKILLPAEWDAFQAAGSTQGAPIDLKDGYIHFSTAEQVVETARLHFADAGDLILVSVDDATLGDALKWEPSRGGALFPHLFRSLSSADVVAVHRVSFENGAHVFPEDLG